MSKIVHPDLNPENIDRATTLQQTLNRVNDLLSKISDNELVELITKGIKNQKNAKKRILVVEDEFGLQDMFRVVFQMEGYDVKVAVDGDRGYEVYCEFQPDLVFTDVVMPKMSGLELVAKIREIFRGPPDLLLRVDQQAAGQVAAGCQQPQLQPAEGIPDAERFAAAGLDAHQLHGSRVAGSDDD